MTLGTAIGIGIDVGATSCRAALVDGQGQVLSLKVCPTPRPGNAAPFFAEIEEFVRDAASAVSACDNSEPRTSVRAEGARRRTSLRPVSLDSLSLDLDAPFPVGLALPATLNDSRDTVVRCVNLPFLEGESPRGHLSPALRRRLCVLTDAEAATWGEYSARKTGADNFAHLRLGTGVACGVVVKGELLRLDRGRKTHPDFLVVDNSPEADPCPCGLRGCLETVASGSALAQQTARLGLGSGMAGLEEACRGGSAAALGLRDGVAGAVDEAMCNLAERFGVNVVTLGGGVIEHWPSLMNALDATVAGEQGVTRRNRPRVERAALGDQAGAIGAALLAQSALHPAAAPSNVLEGA